MKANGRKKKSKKKLVIGVGVWQLLRWQEPIFMEAEMQLKM